MPGVINDLRGQRFGRLTVPEGAAPVIRNHNAYWPVIYDCGQVGLVAGFHLSRGETVSCGCWRADPAVRRAAKLQPDARRRALAELVGQPPGVACAAYYQRRGRAKFKSGDQAGAHWDFAKSQAVLFNLWRQAPGKTPERRPAATHKVPWDALQASAKRRRRAAASRKTGTAPEPERHPDKAAEIPAENAPASANRGGPDVDAGRYQRAIEEFDKKIQLQPSHGAYIRRGNAFADLGQYQRAIEDFDRAIQLRPDVLYVYYLRGLAKFQSGDKAGAQRDFQRAKDLGF